MKRVIHRCLRAMGAVAVFAAMMTTASAARAQTEAVLETPRPRQGYYVSLGIYQLGNLNVEKDDYLGVWSGAGQALRLGQMLNRRLGMGLSIEMGAAQGETDGRKQESSIAGLSIEGQYVFFDRLALHGGLGVGFAQIKYKEKLPGEENKLRGAAGSYYMLGVSYDFFPWKRALSGGLALAPALRVRYLPGDDVDAVAMFLGIEVTWWTGLPRNQLDLPPDKAFKKD